jgi:hypothetical protein
MSGYEDRLTEIAEEIMTMGNPYFLAKEMLEMNQEEFSPFESELYHELLTVLKNDMNHEGMGKEQKTIFNNVIMSFNV